jgi:hypothetical protein
MPYIQHMAVDNVVNLYLSTIYQYCKGLWRSWYVNLIVTLKEINHSIVAILHVQWFEWFVFVLMSGMAFILCLYYYLSFNVSILFIFIQFCFIFIWESMKSHFLTPSQKNCCQNYIFSKQIGFESFWLSCDISLKYNLVFNQKKLFLEGK